MSWSMRVFPIERARAVWEYQQWSFCVTTDGQMEDHREELIELDKR